MSIGINSVFHPVLYMLKRQRRSIYGVADELGICDSKGEGAQLIREGHLLMVVDGDENYLNQLYYDERGILSFFIRYNKNSGRVEKWSLQFGEHAMLERYDYELINEGDNMQGDEGIGVEDEVLDDEL